MLPQARETAIEQVQKQMERLPPQAQPFVQQLSFGLKHKHTRVIKGGNVKITRWPKRKHF